MRRQKTVGAALQLIAPLCESEPYRAGQARPHSRSSRWSRRSGATRSTHDRVACLSQDDYWLTGDAHDDKPTRPIMAMKTIESQKLLISAPGRIPSNMCDLAGAITARAKCSGGPGSDILQACVPESLDLGIQQFEQVTGRDYHPQMIPGSQDVGKVATERQLLFRIAEYLIVCAHGSLTGCYGARQ